MANEESMPAQAPHGEMQQGGHLLIGTSSQKVRSAMSTMKAVRARTRGGPEVLRYENAPVPKVGASEVLVEVSAAGRDRSRREH